LSTASAIEPPAGASRYHGAYQHALRDPWVLGCGGGHRLVREAGQIFDPSAGVYGRWYVGATCNTCFNAVDRHVLRAAVPSVPSSMIRQ
jgi:hypothetical protein